MFSPVEHKHTPTFSPVEHEHTPTFSPVEHKHTPTFSPVEHKHTPTFSPVEHEHTPTKHTSFCLTDMEYSQLQPAVWNLCHLYEYLYTINNVLNS